MRPVLIAVMISVAVVSGHQTTSPPGPPAMHALLDAYAKSDLTAVSRHMRTGRDVDAILPDARAWIESAAARGWDVASAVLLLDLADAALRLPDPSPRAAIQLVAWGREAMTRKRAKDDAPIDPEFELRWHRVAMGILQGAQAWSAQQDYLRQVERRLDESAPAYVALARGIALEQRYAGGSSLLATNRELTRAREQAVQFYDRAAEDPRLRAEASARAANVLLRLGRQRDALTRVDAAGPPAENVVLMAWLAYLRGQSLAGLGNRAEALAAYEHAFRLSPESETIRTALAAALRALGRMSDAAAVEARAAPAGGDSEPSLERGDYRFVAGWLASLRREVPTSIAPAGTPVRPPVPVLLDRYASGDYAFVEQAFRGSESLARFTDDFRAAADQWVRSATADDARRRQLVIAALTLEAAHTRGPLEWWHGQLLVEWACARLRRAPVPDEVERLWMRAAAALMEGFVSGSAVEDHATHALKRFPGDPVLTMAHAVAAELRAGPDDRSGDGVQPPGNGLLNLAVSRLTQASKLPAYHHEAELRLGYTALRRGRAADALAHLTEAVASDDPETRYLAHLLRGRSLSLLNRPDDAAEAYGAARATIGTQTAEILTADALARAGRRVEAAAIAEAMLTRDGWPADPWQAYGQGDFRHWPRLLQELRSALR